MKAKFLPIIVAALASTSAAQADEPWSPVLGVRAGMEVSVPAGARNMYKSGAGLNVGLVAQMPLGKGFFFEPGAYFDFMSMTAKDLVSFDDEYFYEGAANLYSLRLPFNFGYSIALRDDWVLDIYTGPAVNFNISARQDLDPNFSAPEIVPDRTIDLFDHGWKRVDAKWGFGINATLAGHYVIGLNANVALSPLASFDTPSGKVRIHRNSVTFMLGYNF